MWTSPKVWWLGGTASTKYPQSSPVVSTCIPMLSSLELSSICTANALRLEHAVLPKPRFSVERVIVLPAEFAVALESSELMDNPDKLKLDTLQRVIIRWLPLILTKEVCWCVFERRRNEWYNPSSQIEENNNNRKDRRRRLKRSLPSKNDDVVQHSWHPLDTHAELLTLQQSQGDCLRSVWRVRICPFWRESNGYFTNIVLKTILTW